MFEGNFHKVIEAFKISPAFPFFVLLSAASGPLTSPTASCGFPEALDSEEIRSGLTHPHAELISYMVSRKTQEKGCREQRRDFLKFSCDP